MKVIIREGVSSYDDSVRERLIIDGEEKEIVGSLSECPEDAIIGRDLVSCSDIAKYIRLGYDAAKRGEELSIEHEPDYED
jgi:hypothetical protein